MDSDQESYHSENEFYYPDEFENGCSKNSTQKQFTKYSTEENSKHVICRARLVRIGKNCALDLEYGPGPAASGRTQRAGSYFPWGYDLHRT